MKKYIAEFIGTFVLVLFACGTACVTGCSSAKGTGYLLTALAFGLVIVAMAYSIGNISGCHINPAVSIAMLVSKKLCVKDFIGYVIAQFLGAIAGAGVLKLIIGNNDMTGALGSNALYIGDIWLSLIIEIILTFVFVIAILGVTSKVENGAVAGIVIGLTLTLVHILGIAFTGTSVNPARSFGPALFAGGDHLACVWVFIVAPLVGGVLAALVYKFLTSEKAAPKAEKAEEAEEVTEEVTEEA
ncbi:MAG: MIP family channel protein [Clostridia bacterium]|nr:MIP family channel protein [Clostridia bacterium]